MIRNCCFALLGAGLLAGCSAPTPPMQQPTLAPNNLMIYQDKMFANHERIGKKYRLREVELEEESIYSAADLSDVLQRILAIGGFRPQILAQGIDSGRQEYYSRVSVDGRDYEFRNPTNDSKMDKNALLDKLEKITAATASNYHFSLTHTPYEGETFNIIYTREDSLELMAKEGFPCTAISRLWQQCRWPQNRYTMVLLPSIPDFETLKTHYLQTIQALKNQGCQIPALTTEEIYFTDIFDSHSIDICIDGEMNTCSNAILDNTVRCYYDGYGVLLAYVLVKDFNGRPVLFQKDNSEKTSLDPSAFFRKAEAAFGKS